MRPVPVLAVVAIVASVARASWTGRSRFVLAANVPKRHHGGKKASKASSRKAAVVPRKRYDDFDDDDDDDYDDFDDGFVSEEDDFDGGFASDEEDFGDDDFESDEDEFVPPPPPPRSRRSAKGGGRRRMPPPPPPRKGSRSHGSSRGGSSRGGRSHGGGGGGGGGSSKSRSRHHYRSPGGGGRRAAVGSSRGMVPYQHYRQGPSMTERMLQATKEMALTAAATSKAAAVAASKKSMDTMKKAQRAAKEKTSSDFEKLLLRATSPEDTPVMLPDMTMLFKEIKYFPRRARGPGVNPYEKTLHKLWNKIAEKDWRTTSKGVDILHRMARDCKPKDCKIFAEHVGRLKRARHVRGQSKKKKMLYRYFDPRGVVGSLDPAGEPYAAFVKAYFNFVMLRLKCFTGRFDEPKAAVQAGAAAAAAAGSGGSDADAAAAACPSSDEVATLLANMRTLVELGLAVDCVLPPEGAGGKAKAKGADKKAAILDAINAEAAPAVAEPNIVVCDCQYLVADDLEQLWKGISLLLKQILSKSSPLSLGEGDDGADAAAALCEWWLDALPRLAAWRKRYKRSMLAIKMRAADPNLEEYLSAADVVGALRAMEHGLEPNGSAEAAAADAAAAGGAEEDDDDDEEEEEEGDEDDEEVEVEEKRVEEKGGTVADRTHSGGSPPNVQGNDDDDDDDDVMDDDDDDMEIDVDDEEDEDDLDEDSEYEDDEDF